MPALVIGTNMKSGATSPTAGVGIAVAGVGPTGVAAVTATCGAEAHAADTATNRSGLKRVMTHPQSVAAKIQSQAQKWTDGRSNFPNNRLKGGLARALIRGGRMAAAKPGGLAMKNSRMLLLVPAAM